MCKEFRSTNNDWHLGRVFGGSVALNQSFIECDPSKRIHADQVSDTLQVMVSHSIKSRRVVSRRADIGRVL